MGRIRLLTMDCFWAARRQRLLYGGELSKAYGMTRPIGAAGGFLSERPVYPGT